MRSVVVEALSIAAVEGLPGDHHFFVSFLTHYPGVHLSARLRQHYPQEITIVLQYQFENLEVLDDYFSVTLTFDGVAEQIQVPFHAITAFSDPSVNFGLQFKHPEAPVVNNDSDYFADAEAIQQSFFGETEGVRNKTKESELASAGDGNVVHLDHFRRKKESS
jgi:hypothetical protein